ncbi:MAG: DUF2877 domain-containing protein [Acidimicrobiia bacterium]
MAKPEKTGTSTTTHVRVSGVASLAVHSLLTGAGTEGTVVRTSGEAVWLRIGDQVLVVAIGDEARLPNGIHLPGNTAPDVLSQATEDATALIGRGRLVINGLSVTVNRWWDPRPVLPRCDMTDLAARSDDLPWELPDIDTRRLRESLALRSAGGILHTSRTLLGKGLGETPEGDDLLIGAMASTRLLAEAAGQERIVALVAGLSMPLVKLAEARTNMLSTALIRLALRGQIAEPAGDLIRALAGKGDVASSHLHLIRLGRTSGPALAAGVVLGAQALVTHAQKR